MTALAQLAAGAVQDWTAASEFAACTLEADPRSVRTARDFARSTLRCWERDDQIPDVEVVVSELVTNALRHGLALTAAEPPPHPVVLALLRQGTDVVCAVFDPGAGVPLLREAGPGLGPAFDDTAESGRGLHVVECLSDAWGWSAPGPDGKAVWARFSASPTVGESRERPHPHEDPLDRLLLLVEILTGSTPARLSQAAAA